MRIKMEYTFNSMDDYYRFMSKIDDMRMDDAIPDHKCRFISMTDKGIVDRGVRS